MIEHALRTLLLANTSLTALVGERIYYVKASQKVESPYIVFFKVSGSREQSHSGSSQLAHPRFQFSTFSKTYYEAKQIAAQIQATLDGYVGSESVQIYACLYDDETDNYEDAPEYFQVNQDFIIWHKEA